MTKTKTQVCPVCANSRTYYSDHFWRCKKCLYQFADLQEDDFTKSYYQEDIGLKVQNVLEGKDKNLSLRKYTFLALKKINSMTPGLRICDIGCGTGMFLQKLKQKGQIVYGYDINKIQTEYARKKNKLTNVADAQTLKEYCNKIGVSRGCFDIITCFEVIEHIPDVNEFLHQIFVYLKPGGLLIFSTPNNERIQIHERWDYPPIHVSRFKKKNIELLLKKHKLNIKSFMTFNELGYYTGNLIAKMKFSQQALEHMVKASSDVKSAKTSSRNAQIFRLLSLIKKMVCILADIPLYLFLETQKRKGHTMFVIADKSI